MLFCIAHLKNLCISCLSYVCTLQVKHKLTENEVLAVHGWLAVLILRSPDDWVGGDLCAVIKFQDCIIPLQLRLWGRLAVSAVVVWCGIADL